MRKLVALPVLSADALSSVAYGPQAMLAVLILAGLPGLSYTLPVGAAIVVLMLAVGVSYRQTIRAYPQGGGSYIVASEELGRVPGLMAAAGLLIDYVMTVAVSIASGVAAITSAYLPVQPATVWIGVGVIVILLARTASRGDKGPWWSAGDLELVDDDRDAARHPRDADDSVAFGRVRTCPVRMTVLPLVSTCTSLSSGTSALRSRAFRTSCSTSAGSTPQTTSISFVT